MRSINRKSSTKKKRLTRRTYILRGCLEKLRQNARITTSVLALSILLFGPVLLWLSGYPQKFYEDLKVGLLNTSAKIGFRTADIFIQGRKNTRKEALLKAIGLSAGSPIYQKSPKKIRTDIEALPWVRYAVVQRRLPDAYHIAIQERQPVALWQYKKKHYLVDGEGTVISRYNHAQYAHLPIIVGSEAPRHAREILELLGQFPKIRERLTALTWVGNRRWDLQIDQKITVRLPDENPREGLERLAMLMNTKKLHKKNMTRVDLRHPDHMILLIPPMARALIKGKKGEKA